MLFCEFLLTSLAFITKSFFLSLFFFIPLLDAARRMLCLPWDIVLFLSLSPVWESVCVFAQAHGASIRRVCKGEKFTVAMVMLN